VVLGKACWKFICYFLSGILPVRAKPCPKEITRPGSGRSSL